MNETKQYRFASKGEASGKVLLIVACIMLALSAITEIYDFVYLCLHTDTINWSDPLFWISDAASPLVSAFCIVAVAAGVCYLLNKGPFVSLCSFCAIVGAVIVITDIVFSTRNLVKTGNWNSWLISAFTNQLGTILYVVGWAKLKDIFD